MTPKHGWFGVSEKVQIDAKKKAKEKEERRDKGGANRLHNHLFVFVWQLWRFEQKKKSSALHDFRGTVSKLWISLKDDVSLGAITGSLAPGGIRGTSSVFTEDHRTTGVPSSRLEKAKN